MSGGMFARVASAAVVGIEAAPIDVEVDVAVGLPGCHIVGLADAGVREGRVRIRGALENSGFKLPPRRITVNLAPADLRKDGAAFDVPIAVGMLCAAGVVDAAALAGTLFVGELALDGTLRPVRGVLPIAAWARGQEVRRLFVPPENACEAAAVGGCEVQAPRHLGELVALLRGEALAVSSIGAIPSPPPRALAPLPDLARRARPGGAAAGAGDRGGGRSQPALRRPARLGQDDAGAAARRHLAAADVRRGAGDDDGVFHRRPAGRLARWSARARFARRTTRCRRPGWWAAAPRPAPARSRSRTTACCFSTSCSSSALRAGEPPPAAGGSAGDDRARPARGQLPDRLHAGGGAEPLPLRLPRQRRPHLHLLVDGDRRLSRAPLGSAPRSHRPARRRAGAALPSSSPRATPGESTAVVRARVVAARERQLGRGTSWNARLGSAALACRRADRHSRARAARTRRRASGPVGPRHHRVRRVARTIADLEGSAAVRAAHLAEALQYRVLDQPVTV